MKCIRIYVRTLQLQYSSCASRRETETSLWSEMWTETKRCDRQRKVLDSDRKQRAGSGKNTQRLLVGGKQQSFLEYHQMPCWIIAQQVWIEGIHRDRIWTRQDFLFVRRLHFFCLHTTDRKGEVSGNFRSSCIRWRFFISGSHDLLPVLFEVLSMFQCCDCLTTGHRSLLQLQLEWIFRACSWVSELFLVISLEHTGAFFNHTTGANTQGVRLSVRALSRQLRSVDEGGRLLHEHSSPY